MRSQLIIFGQDVELIDEIVVSVNHAIANIREPDKRNSSYTKTIKIPGTKKNNILFSHLFEVSKESNVIDFNPNKKAPARLLVDEVPIISGFARLMKINIEGDKVDYDLVIYAALSDLFTDFSDDPLYSLDFTDLSHIYNVENITESWDAPYDGLGYFYPIVDNAKNDLINFKISDFTPALWFYDIIKRIEAKYGYTFQSEFLESAYFKKLLLLLRAVPELSPIEIEARSFRYDVATPSFILGGIVADTQVGGSIQKRTLFPFDIKQESNFPTVVYDARSIATQLPFSTQYRPSKGGFYDIRVSVTINLTNELIPGQSPLFPPGINTYRIYASYTSTLQDSPPTAVVTKFQDITSNGITDTDHTIDFLFENVYLKKGGGSSFLVCRILAEYRGGGNNLGGSSSVRLLDSSYVEVRAKQGAVKPNDTLEIAPYIYPDMKIRDFFKSVINMHNLYIRPDVNNDKILYIEPASLFYEDGGVIDYWELDTSKPIEITPIGELTKKKYKYKYKQDTDYLNTFYLAQWGDEFGSNEIEVDNDFVTSEVTTELIFSPTINADRAGKGRSLPSLVQADSEGFYEPYLKYKPRVFVYGGEKSCSKYRISVDEFTQYPFVCHIDSDVSPSLDILFSVPQELYWGLGTAINNTYTNNNLYNKYYKQFLDEITDKDSKVYLAYFNLTPLDVYRFSFSDKINLDGNIFRVNKIIDFDPISPKSTRVELLKIKNKQPFEGTTVGVGVNPPGVTVSILEGGLDEVRNISATTNIYIVEGGLNEVRNIAATGDTYIIQG